jgi:hypothetical protein
MKYVVKVNQENYKEVTSKLTRDECIMLFSEKSLAMMQIIIADFFFVEAEYSEFDLYLENIYPLEDSELKIELSVS